MLSIGQNDRATVADLTSIGNAANTIGLSWWQVRRLMDKNEIEWVKLPNGHRAVVKSSLEAYSRRNQK